VYAVVKFGEVKYRRVPDAGPRSMISGRPSPVTSRTANGRDLDAAQMKLTLYAVEYLQSVV